MSLTPAEAVHEELNRISARQNELELGRLLGTHPSDLGYESEEGLDEEGKLCGQVMDDLYSMHAFYHSPRFDDVCLLRVQKEISSTYTTSVSTAYSLSKLIQKTRNLSDNEIADVVQGYRNQLSKKLNKRFSQVHQLHEWMAQPALSLPSTSSTTSLPSPPPPPVPSSMNYLWTPLSEKQKRRQFYSDTGLGVPMTWDSETIKQRSPVLFQATTPSLPSPLLPLPSNATSSSSSSTSSSTSESKLANKHIYIDVPRPTVSLISSSSSSSSSSSTPPSGSIPTPPFVSVLHHLTCRRPNVLGKRNKSGDRLIWTHDEEAVLEKAMYEFGNQWALMEHMYGARGRRSRALHRFTQYSMKDKARALRKQLVKRQCPLGVFEFAPK